MMKRLMLRFSNNFGSGAGNAHPFNDILLESTSFLLLEDNASTLRMEA